MGQRGMPAQAATPLDEGLAVMRGGAVGRQVLLGGTPSSG